MLGRLVEDYLSQRVGLALVERKKIFRKDTESK